MPAAVGTVFNWVAVTGGVWTKIASGPLVTGLPLQAIEFAARTPSSSGRTITWTLDGYNAALPFYNRDTGTTTGFFLASPPIGHTGSWAGILAYNPSPWVDFVLLTNISCYAHIALL